ncbi:hypothetical protein GQ600_4008 [Phytophthora cactorum]|nr:hypothetical protein GQ600_4008 [Phytophthora cactorum]
MADTVYFSSKYHIQFGWAQVDRLRRTNINITSKWARAGGILGVQALNANVPASSCCRAVLRRPQHGGDTKQVRQGLKRITAPDKAYNCNLWWNKKDKLAEICKSTGTAQLRKVRQRGRGTTLSRDTEVHLIKWVNAYRSQSLTVSIGGVSYATTAFAGASNLPDIIGSAAAATLLMSYAPLTHRSPKNAVVNQPAQPITAQSFEVSTSARSLLSVFGSTINDQAAAITTDNRNNIGTVDTNAGGGREMDTHFGFGEGSSTYSSPAPTNDSEHNGGIQNTISTNVDDLSEASTGGCSDTGASGNDGDGNEAHMPADDIEAYAVIDLEEEEGYETDSEYNENVDINIDACDDISSDEDEEAVSADDELLEMSQNKTQIKAVKHSGWRYGT